MNRDIIYRQAAIDAVTSLCDDCDSGYCGSCRVNDFVGEKNARKVLEDVPPAQPEIIRCMDCKHYYYADNHIPQEQRYTCDLDGDRWSADSFCSFAERREE